MLEHQVEEASLRAWPAFREERLGPWLLRFGNGYTKRANSATLTLAAKSMDPLSTVGACEERYRAAGLRPCLRLPSFATPTRVDALLERNGYELLNGTEVLVLPLEAVSRSDGASVVSVDVDAWIAAFAAFSGSNRVETGKHKEVLAAIRQPLIFAAIPHEGEIVSCGLGVHDSGLFGIVDIVTAPEHRRQGHGRQLIQGMLNWAFAKGARCAYLQVVEGNVPARRLYARLGFRDLHRYWYRAPADAGRRLSVET